MTMEWRDVPGYEGLYIVSDTGRIVGLHRGEQRPRINEDGYYQTSLCKNGKMKTFTVHRLVAIAFIENPEGKPTVNHKDENRLNNNVSNLEWATVAEQNVYGTRLARVSATNRRIGITRAKPVVAIDKGGNEYQFTGIHEAARSLGLNRSNITQCLRGLNHTCGGFAWRYAKDGDLRQVPANTEER